MTKLLDQAKQLAKRSPLSMRQINEKSGVHKCTSEKWFSGRNAPQLPLFEAYLNAMGYELRIVKIPREIPY